MEEQKFSFQGTLQKFKEYLKNTKDLTVLTFVDKFSSLISSVVADGLMIVFGFFILLFLSIGLGFYFGELFDSNACGFLAVAGIYFILALILMIFKSNIEKSLMDLSIRKLLKKWNEANDDK